MPTPEEPTVCHLMPFTAADHNMLADAQMWLSEAEEVMEGFVGYDADTLRYLIGDARSALAHMQMAHALDPNIPDSDALREADDAEAARETEAWLNEQTSCTDTRSPQGTDAHFAAAFEQIVDRLW